ncbi:ricin-type beta-trefoil lectin domain protein [Actinoplanes sp. NPDC051346]|uniref:ricin-type beta-trefoil lectin domain protein n=1 Tax=Actinoplanes sp. NPDC051346 TaxID=3155048 RepID=UPI00341DBE84
MSFRRVQSSWLRFRTRRTAGATAVGAALALALSLISVPPAQAAPDWNLGNTGASQISDLNAQATGPIRNVGLGKCLEVLNGGTANGTAAVSSACSGATSQSWTYQRETSLWDDGTIRPAGAANKCLTIISNNGGSVQSISIGGTTQMLLTQSGQVWAKTGVGLGGWTKESDYNASEIAVGSDGTQLMYNGGVYARNGIGVDGWTYEGGYGAREVATNGGVQMYLGSDGVVYARNSIGDANGWVTESAAGAKAIAVGSDGTQMMIGSDGAVYARSSIGGPSGWTKELAPGAQAIATNGGVQMLVGSDNHVYARTGIGTSWTKESTITATDPDFDTAIAAGSDGTQLMVGSDGYLYAKKGVSAGGWTKELANAKGPGFGTSIAAGAGGLHAAVNSTGYVAARTGIGTAFTTETDLTTEKDSGRPVQLFDCHDWDSQHWIFQIGKTGSHQLYNTSAGRCVDTPSGSTANGVALWMYACNGTDAQRFSGTTTPLPPSGPITNTAMTKCASPAATTATPAVGTAVVLNACNSGYNGGPKLQWTLTTDGKLTTAGMCLGVNGGETSTANGSLTVLAKCAATLDQQWAVGWDTSNRPRLLNPNSGRCLDVPNSSTTVGTQLQLYNCNNSGAQVWDVPHASRTFTSPATAVPSVIPPGTGWERAAAMNTAELVRINRARLGLVLHAAGSNGRKAAAETLAAPDTAMNKSWYDWLDESWVRADGGPLDQDVAAAKVADQARAQREDGREHFLYGYPMSGLGPLPDYDTDVVDFMSTDSTFWLATHAIYAEPPTAKAEKAAQDKVKEIAARHAASDPSDAWVWNMYANNAIDGSADDVRRFIQYDGWPTVAPEPGTPEFRVEVEAIKTRWAQGDPTNPLDPDDVLLDVLETAWAEWQAELNSQAQPRADILAAEMQALEAMRASAETMHDGLDYAWTARGILWAQDQKVNGPQITWGSVDMSRAPGDLKLIKAKVAALAEAAKNSAAVAKDAADKAVAIRTAAYATATANGLPAGRGLTYAQQSAQVAQAAAASTQATVNAMQTVVAAVNATLANSATLLANASAQAHAARALYLRQSAQDSAARAAQLAAQAKEQATAAANAAAKVAADKAKIATVEASAKVALAKADAAAADAAKQAQIAADAKETAERERQKAADANATAQQQAAIAEAKKNEAQAAAGRANDDEAAALRAESDAAAAASRAEDARRTLDKLMAEAAVADAKAAAAAGTGAADAAEAEARRARSAANAAGVAADNANAAANAAQSAAARARTAATKARAAADRAYADVRKAEAAAAQTRAASIKGRSLAADAIENARKSAEQAALARQSAADAKAEAASAKQAAQQARTEAAAALADSAVASGQAMATGQAAQEAAAAAATVAAPADEAISLADPWATTDSAAGLASLSSQAAKTIAEAQANVAAAQAAQAAVLAAAAQDAANRAAGDAKLAAQAAADAAASASKAAASAAAATKSANQAAADAKATQQASARIDDMDAKAQLDVEKARNSAEAADGSADAAEAAADDSERDAAAARGAADNAASDASLADGYADDAEASAVSAREAADNAEASADAAQASLNAINQTLANNPQSPGDIAGSGSNTNAIPTELDNVYRVTVQTGYSFDPTSDCVGTGGCDVTGNYRSKGYHVYLLASCVTPSSSDPNVCVNTGSGPQVALDELMTEPFDVTTPAKIHVTQQQMLESTLKALPGILFGEFIGCYKKLTPGDDGGSLLDCGIVLAEVALPFALKGVSLAVKELRVAMIALNVGGIDAALGMLKLSSINARTYLKLQQVALAARARAIFKGFSSCLPTGHSFAAGTGVLMADGSIKAIEDVQVGDWVRNAAPAGGVEAHRVTELHVTTTDTQFTKLTIKSDDRRATIVGTQNHPFYSVTHHDFVAASALAAGDQLRMTGSVVATVEAVSNYTDAMITYDLSVEGVPAYFVVNGGLPVLVHNTCPVIMAVQRVVGLTPGKWNNVAAQDGLKIEEALGGHLSPGHPFIDAYDSATRTGTSIKSVDWRADNVDTAGRFKSKIKSVLNDLHNGKRFDDGWTLSKQYKRGDIDNWVLRVAYPKNPPPGYMERAMELVDEAKAMGIKLYYHPIDG